MDKEKKLIETLNGSSKLVGCRQVFRGLSEGTVRCVIVAEDAESGLKSKLINAAAEKNVKVLMAPSMEWLGRTAGIEVKAATVGLTELEETV